MAAIEQKFDNIDLKFIHKHKKVIIDHVELLSKEYLGMIRPSNDKVVTIDTQAKDQIMFIFCKLLDMTSKMVGEPSDNISEWIGKSLQTSSSEYKIYMFLTGSVQNIKYNLYGEAIEETLLSIVSCLIVDEELCQHVVELFLMFIKRLSESIANLNWESTKKTNTKLVNALLRNMNCNNTNPVIFDEIYEFAEYCKTKNVKK